MSTGHVSDLSCACHQALQLTNSGLKWLVVRKHTLIKSPDGSQLKAERVILQQFRGKAQNDLDLHQYPGQMFLRLNYGVVVLGTKLEPVH